MLAIVSNVLALLLLIPATALAIEYKRIIGAVEVPELFQAGGEIGGDDAKPGKPPTGKLIPLRQKPSEKAPAVSLGNGELRSINLHNNLGAAVYARSGSWYLVHLDAMSTEAWLNRPASTYYPAEKLLGMTASPELALNELWNHKLYKAINSTVEIPIVGVVKSAKPFFVVQIKQTKWVQDDLWLEVQVSQSKDATRPRTSYNGWLNLFAPTGEWILDRDIFW